jgi:hypothetical protein
MAMQSSETIPRPSDLSNRTDVGTAVKVKAPA